MHPIFIPDLDDDEGKTPNNEIMKNFEKNVRTLSPSSLHLRFREVAQHLNWRSLLDT